MTELSQGCILDAGSLGPDADLAPILATLPEWQVWPSTRLDEVAERIVEAHIVLSNKVVVNAAALRGAKCLRYISVLATGTNNIDLQAASEQGIEVSNVVHYSTDSVVQHTLALMLSLAGNLSSYERDVRDHKWQSSPFFCYFNQPLFELVGRVLTIVGAGSQGLKLAQIAEAMGMRVHFARRPNTRKQLIELLPITDVLSFHCPLTEETKDLLDAESIFKLKKGALVINCARGGIVNEEALSLGLTSGHLGGAAVDVTTVEPPPLSHPFMTISHPNFILTPHIAWATTASRQRMIGETAANIRAFLAGRKRNSVTLT